MTVVSIRCQDCDEVKREKHIELGADGAVCDDCRTSDKVKEMKEAQSEAEEEPESPEEETEGSVEQVEEEEPQEEPEESDGDMSPDDFDHQSARSW